MKELGNPVSTEQISEDVANYVNMQIAATKLSVVEHLSTIFGNGVRLILAIVLGAMMLTFLSIAGMSLLGNLIGSMTWGAVIIAGVYLIAAVVIYLLRRRFIDMMVPMFSKMFFTPRKRKDYDDE